MQFLRVMKLVFCCTSSGERLRWTLLEAVSWTSEMQGFRQRRGCYGQSVYGQLTSRNLYRVYCIFDRPLVFFVEHALLDLS